jgi:hypothetical protein
VLRIHLRLNNDVFILDDEWSTDVEFYNALGAKPGTRITTDAGDDNAYEKSAVSQMRLFRY